MLNVKEKFWIFSTFLTSCLGIALLSAALGTRYWVTSQVYRDEDDKANGFVHFGLFEGSRKLNRGFGERLYYMDVPDTLFLEQMFMIRDLYVVTVACVCTGIFFGILSALLSVFNTASDPTEPVCHFPGLITLNTLAMISALISSVTWIVQFFLRLRKNVLIREDALKGGWKSEGLARLGFSFWLVLAATFVFAFNVTVFGCLRRRNVGNGNARKRRVIDTKPNGNLMLY